ncbi:MAG: hypothetical protein PHC53_02785 [Patescibacteria group bacterium]|nr:hypothetical protein [Patescibacteria group bacterium]
MNGASVGHGKRQMLLPGLATDSFVPTFDHAQANISSDPLSQDYGKRPVANCGEGG